MALQNRQEHVALTVSNFGPILQAEVELRPLTVFVGPSNTGKSYLAILVYALHQFFSEYAGSERSPHLARRFLFGPSLIANQEQPALSEDNIQRFSDWVFRELREDSHGQELHGESSELPGFVSELLRPVLANTGQFDEILTEEIIRCFGVEGVSNLLRYRSPHSTDFALRSARSHSDQKKCGLGYDFAATREGVAIEAGIPDTLPLSRGLNFSTLGHRLGIRGFELSEFPSDDRAEFMEQLSRNAVRSLYTDIVSEIVGPLIHRAHYLPADRAGVMHAHQVAVRALIASASRTALRGNFAMPTLSGVLGDFLEQLVELAGGPAATPHFYFGVYPPRSEIDGALASKLEGKILRGTVGVEKTEIDYPSFVYRPDTWKRNLPLMNASSMVSELAPVVLYLRHVVRPGELLIVEEPESHLHPAMQVEFIRFLAEAVHSGIRLVITTHSEWVLEELANLVRLSSLPEDRRDNLESSDYALNEHEVGAWFFQPGEGGEGSVVREIPLDVEEGGFTSGFGLITRDLYNRWTKISERIEER